MPRKKKEGQFLNAKISQELFDRVEAYCEKTRLSKTAVMEIALQEYLDRVTKENDNRIKGYYYSPPYQTGLSLSENSE